MVFLYRGTRDTTYNKGTVNATRNFFQQWGIPADNIHFTSNVESGHLVPGNEQENKHYFHSSAQAVILPALQAKPYNTLLRTSLVTSLLDTHTHALVPINLFLHPPTVNQA